MNMMTVMVMVIIMMTVPVRCQVANATVSPLDPCQHDCQYGVDGLFAEGCCEQTYCQCYGGHEFLNSCEEGQVFNEEIQNCDWAWHVPCCNVTTPVPTTPPSEACRANTCEEDGFFPEGVCEADFCQCVGGIGHMLHCQEGLYYNPNTHVCDWPWNNPGCLTTSAPEGNSTVPVTNTPPPTTAPGGNTTAPGPTTPSSQCSYNCTEANGEFAEGCCENSFCTCYQGEGFLQHCPPGAVFNEEEGICDEPSTVACCQAANTTTTLATNSTDPVTTISPDDCGLDCAGHLDGAFAEGCCLPNYCVCEGGVGFPHACNNGTVFDDVVGFCHNPANVACCEGRLSNLFKLRN